MTEQKIGAQLDAIGLTADVEDGYSIAEATVHYIAEAEDGSTWSGVTYASNLTPTHLPVPSPVEVRTVTVAHEGQSFSDEQRERINRWLRANGIDPKRVALKDIVIESKVRGDREGRRLIGFTEFYEDADGRKVINERDPLRALTYPRWVRQKVALEPDPSWDGWPEYYRQQEERKAREAEES